MTLSSEHERTSSLSPSAPPSGTAATPTDAWNIFPSTARQQIRQQASHLRRRLLQKAGRQSCHFQHRARVRLFEPRYRSWYTAGGILWRTQFGTPEIVGSRYKHSCSDCRIQTRVSFSYTAYSGLPQSHQMTRVISQMTWWLLYFKKMAKKWLWLVHSLQCSVISSAQFYFWRMNLIVKCAFKLPRNPCVSYLASHGRVTGGVGKTACCEICSVLFVGQMDLGI